jgi:protein disulfide-isomerase A6
MEKLQHQSEHRLFLLRKEKKTPILWEVLSNKYQGQVEFATIPDRRGKLSVELGLEVGEEKVSKVLLYPAGSTNFIVYEGMRLLSILVDTFFFERTYDFRHSET